MSATCGSCGKALAIPATGRPPKFCDDRCRKAAARAATTPKVEGGPGRATADGPDADMDALPRPETPQRRSYGRDSGDGDVCPQAAWHGHMCVLASPIHGRVQYCPHARHEGGAIYLFDGLTPAPRPAAQGGVRDAIPPLTVPTTVGPERLPGAPAHPVDASLADPAADSQRPPGSTTSSDPARPLPGGGVDDVQLPLALAAAPRLGAV